MENKISELIEQRKKLWNTYQNSWDDDKLDYTIPEPKEIDELAKEIRDKINKYKDELPVDFIIESLTHLGEAPQVIYDDNGNFAVSVNGFSPIPTAESGKFEESECFTISVEPEMWYSTIREALNHYLKS